MVIAAHAPIGGHPSSPHDIPAASYVWIAKGAIVASAIFALQKTSPEKLIWAFPVITAFSYASLTYGVKHNQLTQVCYTFKVARIGAAVLWGTLGVWRLSTFFSQTLLGRLTTSFCLLASLSALDTRFNKPLYAQMQRLRQQAPGSVELLQAILFYIFRIPFNRLTCLMNEQELLSLVNSQIQIALLKPLAFKWKDLALIEEIAGPTEFSVYQERQFRQALQFLALLPVDQRAGPLETLMIGIAGKILPQTIQKTLNENPLFREKVEIKLNHLRSDPLLPLREKVAQIEAGNQLNLMELQQIEASLKKIVQDIRQLPLAHRQEQFVQTSKEGVELMKKVATLLTKTPRLRTTDETDLSDYILDHLFESLSDMLANDTETRKTKEKDLKELLCAYFECEENELYQKMSDSRIATLKDLIEQKICTQEEIENRAIFLEVMQSYLKSNLPSQPTPKTPTYKGSCLNPKVITESLNLAINLPVIIGKATRIFVSAIFMESASFWKLCTVMAKPFGLYKDLAPEREVHWIKSDSSIQQTYVFNLSLLKTLVVTYPFVVAACFGYRIPRLKTNSFLFAAALGFFY